MRTVHLLGVPIDLGAGRRGTDMGPSALRLTGLAPRIAALGYDVVDLGNIDVQIPESAPEGDATMRYVETIADVCRRVAARTQESAAARALPITLGGDHSIAAGSIAGVARAHAQNTDQTTNAGRVGVIWVDAHGDMNTPASSPSGNVHGMPLAALLGDVPDLLKSVADGPVVRPQDVALIGLRDLDKREQERIRESGVLAITMSEIDRQGLATAFESAIAAVTRDTDGFCLSFDMDAVDPAEAPGVGTPVAGGLTYREAHLLMEMVAESGRLLGIDLVEVNPSLDHENATAELAAQLALSALGHRIL